MAMACSIRQIVYLTRLNFHVPLSSPSIIPICHNHHRSSLLRHRIHITPSPALIPKASAANDGTALPSEEDGVSLGTMKLPLDTDLQRFDSLLFQWANSLCQGANLPLPVPLKVDKIPGGARLGFITIGDGKTEVLVYIDCLVFPATDNSAPIFRAIRNGPSKDKAPPGANIPSIGLGTGMADPGVVAETISTAIKVGYRHIDCAQAYSNQAEIGSALKKLFDDGVVKREDLWITSKLWCTDHAPEDVPKALDRTLQELQLDYLDLYLIHWPVRMKKGSIGFNTENLIQPDIPSTWRAMEALYDSGKARAIGVSNFSSKKLQDLLDIARVPPAVNQVELHPVWKQPKLHAFCESKGIHLSGYSPLGSPGILKSDNILKNPVINMVAENLGKSPAQVALRWGLQMGHSVLPKSTKEERIKENFDVFDWSIPDDLIAKFSEIRQERLLTGTGLFVHEKYGAYKTAEELWDDE